MRFVFTLTLVAIVALAMRPVDATASIFDITPADFVRGINHLEDDDFEGGILNIGGGATTLDVDDVLFGVGKVQTLRAGFLGPIIATDTVGGTTLTAILAIKVATKSGAADPFSYTFGPVSDAEWDAIFDVYDADPFTAGNQRVNSDTMLAVFQDFDEPNHIDNSDPDSGGNGTYYYEFGFQPGGTVADGFWSATAADPPLGNTVADPGEFNLGLFLLDQAVGPPFATHDVLGYGNDYHLEGFGAFFNDPTSPDTVTMPFASDFDFVINAIPEPASIAVWLMISGLIGAGILLRQSRG